MCLTCVQVYTTKILVHTQIFITLKTAQQKVFVNTVSYNWPVQTGVKPSTKYGENCALTQNYLFLV